MLKNYLIQSDLSIFIPEPELNAYLWNGETDYTDQKTGAEQILLNDLINRGYNVRLLRAELALSTSTEEEDIANRNRIVVVTSAVTGTATVTITGANDTDDTFVSCGTVTVTATGTKSALLTGLYKYYKYSTSGTITVTSVGLVETNYDLFYAYKWLELILKSARGEQGDIYDIKAQEFAEMYNNLFASAKLWIDADEDGALDTSETIQTNTARLIR